MNFLISVPDESTILFQEMCSTMRIETLYVSSMSQFSDIEIELAKKKIQAAICKRIEYLIESHMFSGSKDSTLNVESGISGDINMSGIDLWKLPRA